MSNDIVERKKMETVTVVILNRGKKVKTIHLPDRRNNEIAKIREAIAPFGFEAKVT